MFIFNLALMIINKSKTIIFLNVAYTFSFRARGAIAICRIFEQQNNIIQYSFTFLFHNPQDKEIIQIILSNC